MATTSPFHQALHLMLEVGAISHTLLMCNQQKKVATRKVRTYRRYWERTYLNYFSSVMKNQPETYFPKLITSLDYVNPIIKKVVSIPLKKHTSGRQNNQLCIRLVITDQRQGNFPDRERSKNSIPRKAKPKATSGFRNC